MNAMHQLAMACALACSAGFLGEATAAEAPGSSPNHPLSAEQALDADARAVARYRGISTDAARTRLLVQHAAGPIAERIRAQYANRLAGLYIEHEPTSRLVVRLTGRDAVRTEFHDAGGRNLEVAYVVGADRTFAELQQRFEAGFPALQKRVPEVESGYVDERTGEIVIEVLRDEKSARVASLQSAIGNPFGAATRVVEVEEPLVNQVLQGSGRLNFNQSATSTFCTAGFIVETIGSPKNYGALTAGHCQAALGSYAYTGVDLATHTITHVARKFDADTDIGWATIGTNAADVAARFYASIGYRTVIGVKTKAATVVGLEMCGYGTTTGHKCGEVISKAYNPGSLCGPGVVVGSGTSACNASFIRVDAYAGTGACQAGDSGGPWYELDLAAGIHKAGTSLGSRCVYTSIDDIANAALNLQLHL